MQDVVAIIPARGGSKRLPRKNIVDFLGRPIIAYTVAAARDAGCFDRVVVTTEDEEIAAVAAGCGAAIDHRSPDLATDTAGVVDVCVDFLKRERVDGRSWRRLVCLYPTAPLRNSEDIVSTLGLIQDGGSRFAMAITRFPFSPFEALILGAGGTLSPLHPEALDSRERPELRVDNGSTYAVEVEAFLQHRTFYGPGLIGHEMPFDRSIDIDTREDLERAVASARRLAWQMGGRG